MREAVSRLCQVQVVCLDLMLASASEADPLFFIFRSNIAYLSAAGWALQLTACVLAGLPGHVRRTG